MPSKDFRSFRSFRGTLNEDASVYHIPTEMTETTERLRMVLSKDLRRAVPFFPLLFFILHFSFFIIHSSF